MPHGLHEAQWCENFHVFSILLQHLLRHTCISRPPQSSDSVQCSSYAPSCPSAPGTWACAASPSSSGTEPCGEQPLPQHLCLPPAPQHARCELTAADTQGYVTRRACFAHEHGASAFTVPLSAWLCMGWWPARTVRMVSKSLPFPLLLAACRSSPRAESDRYSVVASSGSLWHLEASWNQKTRTKCD